MTRLALAFVVSAALGLSAACGHSEPARDADHAAAAAPALVIPPIAEADGGGAAPAELTTTELTVVAGDSRAPIAARDPRIANHKPQSRARILTEIQSLERRLDTTKRDAADRSVLHRRAAEGYSDLATTSSGPDATRARTEAIKHYSAIVSEHASSAQIDEVFYFLALAHETNGDFANARKSYFALIQRTPGSSYVPLAYFAFGEMFFAEGAADTSKYELAAQAFAEVLKHPAPANPVIPETLLRMGEIHRRRGESEKAQAAFQRLRREFPTSAAAQQLTTMGP